MSNSNLDRILNGESVISVYKNEHRDWWDQVDDVMDNGYLRLLKEIA